MKFTQYVRIQEALRVDSSPEDVASPEPPGPPIADDGELPVIINGIESSANSLAEFLHALHDKLPHGPRREQIAQVQEEIDALRKNLANILGPS